jgi:hypothetical protein
MCALVGPVEFEGVHVWCVGVHWGACVGVLWGITG